MSERPIIFSGPMVRAIIERRKSQTRRVLKPQPDASKISPPFHPESRGRRSWVFMARDDFPGYSFATRDFKAPYAPGDRLWVRESFALCDDGSRAAPRSVPMYAADFEGFTKPDREWDWTPSIHMPRWASRLTLLVTDVRVQRLQDITIDDVPAEGIDLDCEHAELFSDAERMESLGGSHGCRYPEIYPFRVLWDSLHAKRGFGWDANPWVVAITFEVEEAKR